MADEFNPTEWVSTTEAAELTGYATAYFRQPIQRGRLHHVQKRGRDWFLSKDEVLAYAEEMKKLGPTKHDPWRTEARRGDDKGE
jgi:excisionase family DNA binding protein